MKTKNIIRLLNLIIIIIFIIFQTSYSQNPPCDSNNISLSFKTNQLDHVPPLSLDMPYDIMQSYLFMDSICKHSSYSSFNSFLQRQKLNDDSLKKVLHYYYNFWGYNTILAYSTELNKEYLVTGKDRNSPPYAMAYFDRDMWYRMQDLERWPLNIWTLVTSGLIAHIKVDSTEKRYLVRELRTDLIVSAHIIDTIKGKFVPTFKNIEIVSSPKYYHDTIPEVQAALPGTKFQFDYWLENIRPFTNNETFVDSLGNPWTIPGREYIVFLSPFGVGICGDSLTLYYSLWPINNGSTVYNMFPIYNDTVYNPRYEYGIRNGASVSEFKSKIRSLIQDILDENDIILSAADKLIKDIPDNYIYPNPSNGFTTVNFSVDNDLSLVNISLIDELGTQREIFINKYYGKGSFKENIDVSKLSNGIYFLAIRVGSTYSFKKLVVLR